ncbi:MAG: tRNA threonylcarbamoyladenosine biosynthesis protein TsaB [Syntrophus sp. PtaB.Bin001]|nr:MAG: tRNA threonylcarbamoyladenosine biosynthesis protein TsaB [Syntrophus sp. PtaB.Bin001]
MISLAIDTSAKTVGVALLENEDVLVEKYLNLGTNSSILLMPAVEDVFRISGFSMEQVDLMVCTIGPGSFTGLRIGIGTIKGLAMALGKPIVGVSTLDALAFNGVHADMLICPMMDAQRGQIYTALYSSDSCYFLKRIGDERVVDVDAFLAPLHDDILFLGDGAIKYRDRIKKTLTDKSFFAAPHLHTVRASVVGLLGLKKHARGEFLDLLTFTPHYIRLSEAEAKLLQRNTELDVHDKKE